MSIYNKNKFLHNYISRLNIDVLLSYYSELDKNWKNQNKYNEKNYIYLITDNKCHVNIDGVDYFPRAGQMIIIPRGSKTLQMTVNDEPFCKYWTIFDANIEHTNLFDILCPPLCIDVTDMEKAMSLFIELKSLNFQQDLFSALRTKSVFLEVLTMFFQDAQVQFPEYDFFKQDDFCEKIIRYINHHFSENITIEDMGKYMNFHPKYFSHVFKEKMAMTPMKFLKQIRTEHAKSLLINSIDSIEEIMYQCGFSNKSLFAKDFKAATGYSPSEYRKLLKIT